MKNVEVEFLMIMCKCGTDCLYAADHLYETIEDVKWMK
jgi:hypothetical protein